MANVGESSRASTSCNVDSNSSTAKKADMLYPLWKFVTKGENRGSGGRNCSWKCNFCNLIKNGAYTRVRAHLLTLKNNGIATCDKVSQDDIDKMKKLEQEAETYKIALQSKKPPLPDQPISSHTSKFTSMQPPSSPINVKKRKPDNEIQIDCNIQARKQLEAEIARMFYTGGLPFNLARNPYYVSSYSFAANNTLPDFKPPSYNMLKTTLLEEEKENVHKCLEPIKATWKTKGVSIVSDGWSDPQRRPSINIIIACESGPMFVKSIDCLGEVKDEEFIANMLSEVIDETEPQNVVQIVTDNASNCEGAGKLIEGKYPNIYWTPCVVHTLNLAVKSICTAKNTLNNEEVYDRCYWITEIHGDALLVKNYIMNNQMKLAIFNKFSSLKLLWVPDTRFASIVVMLKRLKLLKTSLQSMVVNEGWSTYEEDNYEQASLVRKIILDETWWDKVDYILDFTRPIYEMIRACDNDKPSLHLVYEMWDTMVIKIKKEIFKYENKQDHVESPFYDVIHGILVSRWSKDSTPMYALAHSLNPRFYTEEWLNEIQGRVPPNADEEISTQRLQCFRRLYQNSKERRKIKKEFAIFTQRSEGILDDIDCLHDMANMDAKGWWATYGSRFPMLQSLANKLLGQPSSSSCYERNWSTYKFIHSCTRNKLNPKRAQDLVFIHNNLRLLSRSSEEYTEGRSKKWDVGGDEDDSLLDVGCLEMAELSLE